MSATLGATETQVRIIIRDEDAADYAISEARLWKILLDIAIGMAPDLGLGRDWQTDFLALSDTGSSDFAVAGTNLYSKILNLKNATTGQPIDEVSNQYMEYLRAGSPVPRGDNPTHYTILEGPGQSVVVRFHPRPTAARTVHALREVIPTRTYADATTLPFGDDALLALEYQAAVLAANGMSVVQREDRSFSVQLIHPENGLWAGLARGYRENSVSRLRTNRRPLYGAETMRGY